MEQSKKEHFDKMNIGQLEALAKQKHGESRTAQGELIDVLIYLKTSGRYKENKRYAASSFAVYLLDTFNMRLSTFNECQVARTKYPEISKEYGVGLVAKVRHVCGVAKTAEVLEKIRKADDKNKPGLKRQVIEKIIQANRTAPIKQKVITEWKVMYENEVRLHNETKFALKEAMTQVKELEQQIVRLKATAQKISDIRAIVGHEYKPAVHARA